MGYYIEVPEHKNKAEQIESMFDGMIIPKPSGWDKIPANMALIVCVDNGPFEAAGFCYDEREFLAFTDPGDKRRKKFVLIDRKKAEELSGYARRHR